MPEFLRFRLWHLFVLVTILAIPCAWYAYRRQYVADRAELIQRVEMLGGEVAFGGDSPSWLRPKRQPNRWGGLLFGDAYGLEEVTGIFFRAATYRPSTQEELAASVAAFPELRWICFEIPTNSNTLDVICTHCPNVDTLQLWRAQLTYDDVDRIAALRQLQWLQVDTRQSDEVYARMKQRWYDDFVETGAGRWQSRRSTK